MKPVTTSGLKWKYLKKRVLYTPFIWVILLLCFCSPQGQKGENGNELKNYVCNGNMEEGADTVSSWETVHFWPRKSAPKVSWLTQGRNGSRCLQISSKTKTVTGWLQEVELDPDGYYELSGWIKTRDMDELRGGTAIIIGEFRWMRPKIINKDRDWQRVSFRFHNAGYYKVTVICLLGAAGPASGTVYFDDIKLVNHGIYNKDPSKFEEIQSKEFSITFNKSRGVIASLKPKRPGILTNLDYLPNSNTLPYLDESKDYWLGDIALDFITSSGDKVDRVVRVTTADPRYEKKVSVNRGKMEVRTLFKGVPIITGINCVLVSTWEINGKNGREEKLAWTITLSNRGRTPLEIGSIDFPLPVNNNYCLFDPHDKKSQKLLYTRRVSEHKYIGGSGSYVLIVPMVGEPPFFLFYPGKSTQFEFTYHEPSSIVERDRGPDIHGAWPGLTRICLYSLGVIKKNGWDNWLNGHTSLHLNPGEKRSFQVIGEWINKRADLPYRLKDSGKVGIRVVPGMSIPRGTSAYLVLYSLNANVMVTSSHEDTTITRLDMGTHPGTYIFKLEFSGEGLRTVKVNAGKNNVTRLFFQALAPIPELMDRRSRFIADKQYYRNPGDPLDHAILCYDNYHKKVLSDPTDMWGSGGYEGGVTDGMFLALKNVYRPDPGQIKLLETYIHKFVLGKLQNRLNYGVAWTVARPDRIERGYNYIHVINLYEAMTRLAMTWPTLMEHGAGHYLDLCIKTFKAFTRRGVKYQDLGLMGRGNITFLPALLKKFGRVNNAKLVDKEIIKWAKYWEEGDPYPYGSELFFDNTGYETVFFYSDYTGFKDLATQTVKITKAGRGRAPCWFWAGSDQRWWDAVDVVPDYKSFTDFGENCHHYMSGLNGWMLLEAYDKGYDRVVEVGPVGFDGILSSWARVHEDGFGSMSYCPDPVSKNYGFNKFSGDVGLGLWGNLQAQRSYVVMDPVLGLTGYGCRVETNGDIISMYPFPGFQHKLRIPMYSFKINVHGVQVRNCRINPGKTAIKMDVTNPFDYQAKVCMTISRIKPGKYKIKYDQGKPVITHVGQESTLTLTQTVSARYRGNWEIILLGNI